MSYTVTQEMLDEAYGKSPFAQPMDDFCRRWLEEHCDADDLALMKVVRSWFWGPGLTISETDLLTARSGSAPSRDEVLALIDRTCRILEPCFEAWEQSTELAEIRATRDATGQCPSCGI